MYFDILINICKTYKNVKLYYSQLNNTCSNRRKKQWFNAVICSVRLSNESNIVLCFFFVNFDRVHLRNFDLYLVSGILQNSSHYPCQYPRWRSLQQKSIGFSRQLYLQSFPFQIFLGELAMPLFRAKPFSTQLDSIVHVKKNSCEIVAKYLMKTSDSIS